MQDLGRIGDALDSYDAALRLDPRSHVAAFHRGLARLLEGDFERGWPDYEGRLLSDRHPRRNMPFASWHGENPSGRTVLAYAEQGIGDEIMFASCLPELIARAGHVIIDCAPKLAPLFARSFPQATVHGGSQFDDIDWLDALQEPDLAVPVGSLPLYLRPTPGAFPPHSGYLVADSARVRHYRETLARLGPGLKIGLSWRGGTALSRKDQRSLDPAQLAPLFRIEALHFVNLQYDTRPQELASFSPWGQVHDIAEANASFDETAALVAALDGVVSVCTAVIHLSGALGRPVWILAPFSPEWRYGIRGERMPWYPSARVLRQRSRGDWSEPLAEVVARVSAAAKASSPHSGGISPC